MIENIITGVLALSIFLFLLNYFIYPVAVIGYSKYLNKEHKADLLNDEDAPKVSFIIAAYNEERIIEDKIKNTLALDYPKHKLEIIIVSDGSDDNTPNLVAKFHDQVIGLHDPKRAGKSAALNRAVAIAKGDVLVFSDANNDFNSLAIKHLVKHFSDPKVGAVTGAKKIYDNESRQSSQGDGLYWRYESAIKVAESNIESITAAEGEILAVKRSLYTPIDSFKVNDDAAITFDLAKKGYRVLYEPEAISIEQASIDLIDDINVKVRMTFGGFQTLNVEKQFLFPPRTWFACSFILHKVLRWLAPHFLVLIFICSLMLWKNSLVGSLLLAQLAFYSISWYGWTNRHRQLPLVIYIPMYFTVMNYALFLGFLRYLKNSNSIEWKKASR